MVVNSRGANNNFIAGKRVEKSGEKMVRVNDYFFDASGVGSSSVLRGNADFL